MNTEDVTYNLKLDNNANVQIVFLDSGIILNCDSFEGYMSRSTSIVLKNAQVRELINVLTKQLEGKAE